MCEPSSPSQDLPSSGGDPSGGREIRIGPAAGSNPVRKSPGAADIQCCETLSTGWTPMPSARDNRWVMHSDALGSDSLGRRESRLGWSSYLLATCGGAVVVLPVFKMTGSPFLPDPTIITFEFGDSASFSVASMPFHSITWSFRPLLMIS
jgi:hypothetical protein